MAENSESKQTSLDFSDIDLAQQLFGEHNNHLQRISKATEVTINARGNTVFIQGDKIAAVLAGNILKQLYALLKEGYPIHTNDIDYAVRVLSADDRVNLKEIFLDRYTLHRKRPP